MTAEHKISEKAANGSERTRWVPKQSHADNHYLDCEVYAMAAADVLGVRSLYLQAENAQPQLQKEPSTQKPEPPTPPAAVPNWIGTNGNWI